MHLGRSKVTAQDLHHEKTAQVQSEMDALRDAGVDFPANSYRGFRLVYSKSRAETLAILGINDPIQEADEDDPPAC